MKILPFKPSQDFSVGVELEFQIINPSTYNLASRAKEFIRNVQSTKYAVSIKPEITQSMLEINSSVHVSLKTLINELREIRSYLIDESLKIDALFCGGGMHPFQKWPYRKIFPTPRFKTISKRSQYLSKRGIFGLHVHVGCSSPDHALYLTHILARYVPQLIAMSASSPFYQGADTGFDSTRVTNFNSFPICGAIPFVTHWKNFSAYFFKMKKLGIVESMKDFYWDIRPKPEFGTVEIRVCDTPLTFKKAVMIAAYIQALSCFILQDKSLPVSKETYVLYNYNRFQAARYGLAGLIVDPYSLKKCMIQEDILETIDNIYEAAKYLGGSALLNDLKNDILNKKNDAAVLRQLYKETADFKTVVREQCELWMV